MERFEYKTITMKTEGFAGGLLNVEEWDRNLNLLGNEGWELVSAFDTNQSQGSSRLAVAVFKRQIQSRF